jgi:hypothetical protein
VARRRLPLGLATGAGGAHILHRETAVERRAEGRTQDEVAAAEF